MESTLEWIGDVDGHLALLDQTLLPDRSVVLEITELAVLIDAIKRLAVRGAPAIGVAALWPVGVLAGKVAELPRRLSVLTLSGEFFDRSKGLIRADVGFLRGRRRTA